MAGPLEHAGVEDVLSSIRRLVSEDSRNQNANAARAAAPVPAVAETPRPRLVLTPALRVLNETEEDQQQDPSDAIPDIAAERLQAEAPRPAPVQPFAPRNASGPVTSEDPEGAAATADQILSHLSAAVEAEDGAASAPATPHAVSFLNGARNVDQAAARDVFHLQGGATGEAEAAAEGQMAEGAAPGEQADLHTPPWKDPGTTLYHAARALEGVDPAAEPAAESHPDAAEMVAASGQMPPEPQASVPPAAEPSEPAKVTEFHNASARHRAAAVVRKIAEMEASTGEGSASEEQWEPDAETCAPFAEEAKPIAAAPVRATPEPVVPEPVVQAEDTATAGGAAVVSGQEPEPVSAVQAVAQQVIDHTAEELGDEISDAAFDGWKDRDDAALLDEEALREMVIEIVRQELQGALGEKITRNVRKLVRREIHRALTAQNLL